MRSIFTPDGLFFYDRNTGTCLFTNTKKADSWQKPLHVQIALTQQCNLKCWFCYTKPAIDKSYEWPIDRLKVLIKYLDAWGVFGIAFGGGEAFLYPYLEEIVKYTWEQTKLDCSITTNGYAATPQQISALENYVSEIRVSIRGLSDCSCQLEKFLNKKFEVGVNLLLYKENTALLESLIERCRAVGVLDFLVNSFVATGQGANHADKTPNKDDYIKLSQVINKHSVEGLTFKVSGRLAANLQPYLAQHHFVPFCNESRGRILAITADGKLKPSSMSNTAYTFKYETQIANLYRQKIAPN